MEWIKIDERLPKQSDGQDPSSPVLLAVKDSTGRIDVLRCVWVAEKTVDCDDWSYESDDAVYDEDSDVYYWPEGWYEWNQFDETHWRVSDTPIAWMPLPDTDSLK